MAQANNILAAGSVLLPPQTNIEARALQTVSVRRPAERKTGWKWKAGAETHAM